MVIIEKENKFREEKESIYLETTVVSYYTSRPSRDIIALAHQEIKHLANGEIIKKLMKINESLDVHTPIILTPEELMEV